MILVDWVKTIFKKPAFDNEEKSNLVNTKSPNWFELWNTCQVDQNRITEIGLVCKKILDNKEKYDVVETKTGVPWYLVAALHYREASLNFKTCLHNGDPLPGPTKHVPKGRGPFKSWEDAAIDALKYDGLDHIKFETITTCLVLAEKFNGLGYRKTGILSPYIWAGTNQSTETGKYTGDGIYNPFAKEKQLGVAAIFKGLNIT
jgi:lysozyme family protein